VEEQKFEKDNNVFINDLLVTIKRLQRNTQIDDTTLQAINKLQSNQKLATEEFFEIYEFIRKDGPKIEYQSPEKWSYLQ
jgi:hypothetical protein